MSHETMDNQSGPSDLTQKQDEAILAMLASPTIEKAAEAVGINPRTIHRWLENPAFHGALRRARRLSFQQAITLTNRYAAAAVQTLAKIMTDPATPSSSRVTAASTLLKFSRESLELDDLAERVSSVEELVKLGHNPLSRPPPPPPPPPGPSASGPRCGPDQDRQSTREAA